MNLHEKSSRRVAKPAIHLGIERFETCPEVLRLGLEAREFLMKHPIPVEFLTKGYVVDNLENEVREPAQ